MLAVASVNCALCSCAAEGTARKRLVPTLLALSGQRETLAALGALVLRMLLVHCSSGSFVLFDPDTPSVDSQKTKCINLTSRFFYPSDTTLKVQYILIVRHLLLRDVVPLIHVSQ